MKTVLYEADWLGTQPVFFHEKTGKASRNINDVIDFASFEWDADGLHDYLQFGYSVFEHTPVRHVRFLRYCSRLLRDEAGRLSVEYLDDPTDGRLGGRSTEAEVLDLIQARVTSWERACAGEIVIPTSGGFDSRMLNLMIGDKRRIRAFTYGLSEDQGASSEVVHARALAEKLGVRWQQIPLGRFHQYFDEWDGLYGVSTHAHGMYQIEFYRQILAAGVAAGSPLLSGIIGAGWAGGAPVHQMRGPEDVHLLGNAHGLCADPAQSLLRADHARRDAFWEANAKTLDDPLVQALWLMRLKMVLMAYLLRIPESLGFQPWSPFLELDVSMAMITLPPESQRDRVWVRRYFQKHGVDFESQQFRMDRKNSLNLQALHQVPVPPLDETLLREVIRPGYVQAINREVAKTSAFHHHFWRLFPRGSIGKAFEKVGFRDRRLEAYCAYLTLKPLEKLLQRRNAAR
jgi:hypothetical protein